MKPQEFIRLFQQLQNALTPLVELQSTTLTAQRILYRLFFLAQIQSKLGIAFTWPHNKASLFSIFLEAQSGSLGISPRLGPLWEVGSDDQAWKESPQPFPSDLWSVAFYKRLGNLPTLALSQLHELLMEVELKGDSHLRRKTGSYYTAQDVAQALLSDGIDTTDLTGPICDPACGGGVFLLAAMDLWHKTAPETPRSTWLNTMVYGVDINKMSVDICRMNLWLAAKDPTLPMDSLCQNIRWGNALLSPAIRGDNTAYPPVLQSKNPLFAQRPFHWKKEFPSIFTSERSGFKWVIGNPPWIAHAGRAAQPIPPEVRAFYLKRYSAFNGYRTTHGLFCELGAELCDPKDGALAFILPTSVADLKGYGPTRAAVTKYLQPVEPLSNKGDGVFEGVFQPCMFLYARQNRQSRSRSAEWVLKRDNFSESEYRLLNKLCHYETFPAECFGERGLQTSGDLRFKLVRNPTLKHTVSLGVGRDIQAFHRQSESCWAKAEDLKGYLKDASLYARVDIWIRQTARYPVAAKSPGTPFRNSLLAGYSTAEWHTDVLIGLLNAPLLQWFHYQRFRDAREGMPQVKINHLRRYPKPQNRRPLEKLQSLSHRLNKANAPVTQTSMSQLHRLVCDAYCIDDNDAARVWEWYQQR